MSCSAVTLNVTGTKFKISTETLEKLKGLSDESRAMLEGGCLRDAQGQVYVERHPGCFEALLHLCVHGELHMPSVVCPHVFKNEMRSWGVKLGRLENCCYNTMVTALENRAALEGFEVDSRGDDSTDCGKKMSGWRATRNRMWCVLEMPRSSSWAKVYFCLLVAFTLCSLFTIITSTHDTFRRGLNKEELKEYLGDAYDEDLMSENQQAATGDSATQTSSTWKSSGTTAAGSSSQRTETEISSHTTTRNYPETATAENPSQTATTSTEMSSERATVTTASAVQQRTVFKRSVDQSKFLRKRRLAANRLGDAEAQDVLEAERETARLAPPGKKYIDSRKQLVPGAVTSNTNLATERSERADDIYRLETNNGQSAREKQKPDKGAPSDEHLPSSDSLGNGVGPWPRSSGRSSGYVERDSRSARRLQRKKRAEEGTSSSNATSKATSLSVNARIELLDYLDYVTLAFFTLDFCLRLALCPTVTSLRLNVFTALDLVALAAAYCKLLIDRLLPKERFTTSLLDSIECLQIFRIVHIFRLLQDLTGFKVLLHTIKASIYEMLLLVVFLSSGVLLFSFLAFWSDRSAMKSIPDACWWAIVTMTTVGYGDMYPTTFLGKVVGSVCALSGVVVIAVTVPVLVNNFLLFYSYSKVVSAREQEEEGPDVRNLTRDSHVRVVVGGTNKVHVQSATSGVDVTAGRESKQDGRSCHL